MIDVGYFSEPSVQSYRCKCTTPGLEMLCSQVGQAQVLQTELSSLMLENLSCLCLWYFIGELFDKHVDYLCFNALV